MLNEIVVNPPFIKLEQFLKFAGIVSTGGQGKIIILDGNVKVNGEVCLMRGKKLFGGEVVNVDGDDNDYKCVLRINN